METRTLTTAIVRQRGNTSLPGGREVFRVYRDGRADLLRARPPGLLGSLLRITGFLVLAFSVLVVPGSSLRAAPAVEEKPNFLLLYVDNLGYGDLGCYGSAKAITPTIDKLAADGVRFTDFYTASPSCSPSRGALLTGRHPLRNGLNYQLNPTENERGVGLPRTEKIIPQYLAPLGYTSGAFGKWNIGFAPGVRPTERGFASFLGHMSGNIHYFKYLYHGWNDLRDGTNPLAKTGVYSTDLFADAAIQFIQRNKDRPWFAYVPFNAVHFIGSHNVEAGEKVQWQVPAKYLELHGSPPDESGQGKRFQATLTALDDAIGRVLNALDEAGLREKTMVWFISDNGAFMLPGRGLEVQSNRPLRSGGVTAYEGGVRVPAILRWPGQVTPGSVSEKMLSTLDVLPMFVAAAGGNLPADRRYDGRDPSSAIFGGAESPHDTLHWMWDQGEDEQWLGMRKGSLKLVRKADDLPWELYDLSTDLGERQDLASARPQLVQQLVADFESWRTSVKNDPTRSVSTRK